MNLLASIAIALNAMNIPVYTLPTHEVYARCDQVSDIACARLDTREIFIAEDKPDYLLAHEYSHIVMHDKNLVKQAEKLFSNEEMAARYYSLYIAKPKVMKAWSPLRFKWFKDNIDPKLIII